MTPASDHAGEQPYPGPWQSIETAPKDGTRILLLRPGREPCCGGWDDDRYAKKPLPHWTDDLAWLWGRRDAKTRTPTHWMPLPPRPATDASHRDSAAVTDEHKEESGK